MFWVRPQEQRSAARQIDRAVPRAGDLDDHRSPRCRCGHLHDRRQRYDCRHICYRTLAGRLGRPTTIERPGLNHDLDVHFLEPFDGRNARRDLQHDREATAPFASPGPAPDVGRHHSHGAVSALGASWVDEHIELHNATTFDASPGAHFHDAPIPIGQTTHRGGTQAEGAARQHAREACRRHRHAAPPGEHHLHDNDASCPVPAQRPPPSSSPLAASGTPRFDHDVVLEYHDEFDPHIEHVEHFDNGAVDFDNGTVDFDLNLDTTSKHEQHDHESARLLSHHVLEFHDKFDPHIEHVEHFDNGAVDFDLNLNHNELAKGVPSGHLELRPENGALTSGDDASRAPRVRCGASLALLRSGAVPSSCSRRSLAASRVAARVVGGRRPS